MPVPPKPTPPKFCEHCGKRMERKRYPSGLEDLGAFTRRKFCDQECMAEAMEGTIKTPSAKNGRRQAAKTVKPCCEVCGRSDTRLSVHHRDEDPLNNDPANLQTLCGSCHRLTHSPNCTGTPGQRKPCSLCAAPAVRKGYCSRHLSRLKRYGDPLAKKIKTASGWVLSRAAS